MRAPKPLVVRGGLSRTFGSLAGFTALGLLSLGIYLLADAFAHPVDAEAAGVIVAAFAIALAILLFVFLLRPQRFSETLQRENPEGLASRKVRSSGLRVAGHGWDSHKDLPYHRAFVDRSRIRL